MNGRPAKSTCDSCGDPIIWAVTEAGKRMPVDVEPTETGNLILSGQGQILTVTVVSKTGRYPGQKLNTSHFATCKHAKRHRKQVTARPVTPPAMPQDVLFTEGPR